MNTFRIGFIGCGNMASAIIDGILTHQLLNPNKLYIFDIDHMKCKKYKEVIICDSVREVVEKADIIFICTKPNKINLVADEITIENKAFVSIVAGVTSDHLREMLPDRSRIMRIMPNTPMMVGKGAISIEKPTNLVEDENNFVCNILSHLGQIVWVDNNLMDAVTGVSGSGPAYVYLFVDALSQAGQMVGLNEEVSYQLAIETFEGAIAMLKESGKSPEQLIDDVCSPGGTTIEAIKIFEKKDIYSIMQEAVEACVKRSRELSN